MTDDQIRPSDAGRAAVAERLPAVRTVDRAWYADWRYWLGGAVVLFTIWGVESLRKGDLIWPWPVVPLAIWAAVLVALAIAG